MKHVPIEGANIVLAEGQDEYTTITALLQAETRSINAATGEEYDSGPSITIAMKPDMHEALDLLNNKTIYIRVLGTRFPPMAVWVE